MKISNPFFKRLTPEEKLAKQSKEPSRICPGCGYAVQSCVNNDPMCVGLQLDNDLKYIHASITHPNSGQHDQLPSWP